jgi:hypothetical protein
LLGCIASQKKYRLKMWVRVADLDALQVGQVTTVMAGNTAICLVRTHESDFR